MSSHAVSPVNVEASDGELLEHYGQVQGRDGGGFLGEAVLFVLPLQSLTDPV